jgi:hypothetical protein
VYIWPPMRWSPVLLHGADMIVGRRIDRRRFMKTAAAWAAISTFDGIARPYLSRASERPVITHGIQSGDVSVDSGVVWARADRPSRMLVDPAFDSCYPDHWPNDRCWHNSDLPRCQLFGRYRVVSGL